jgi:hypothetical protein
MGDFDRRPVDDAEAVDRMMVAGVGASPIGAPSERELQ